MTLNTYDAGIGDLHIAQRKDIVFIENDVADWQTIAAQAGAGREVIVLDAAGDGLQQMAQALAGRTGIDALHVITHGAEGKLDLGALTLDSTTAAERSSLLASIGASLAPHADILLYGCDVGAGQGAAFVDRLAIATGADVAASSNPTGAASLGGDWNLEIAHGSIETAPVVDAALAAQYSHLLAITAPTTITFASAPLSNYQPRANDDLAYAIPGQTGFLLDVDGAADGIGSYGDGSLKLSPHDVETSVTISFRTGQVFTPTSIDLAGGVMTYGQNLTFTGKDAHGNTIKTATLFAPADDGASSWTHGALNGFTDITSLVITPASGNIQTVLIDNLVLASAHAPPPVVDSVWTSTGSGAYKAGTSININVDFGEAVTVDTTAGAPTLKLETGTTDRNATYVGTSGDHTLVFNYVVQPGDTSSDLDYVGTTALALNGATIKSASSGLAADTTLDTPGMLASLSGVHTIVIDTTAPDKPQAPSLAAASDTGVSASDQLTNDASPTFTGTIANPDVVSVTLYGSEGIVGTAPVVNGHYTVTPTAPVPDGGQSFSIIATDAAGNTSPISDAEVVFIDTAAPTMTVTSGATAPLKIGESATVTFTFSEDPGTFTSADVTVSGGTLGPMSGAGTTRTATFTPTANTDDGVASIAVHAGFYSDDAGNGNAAGILNIAYDTKAPALTIVTDKAVVTAGETASITFVFSEDPGASFTAEDVTAAGGTVSALSGSGTTRTAILTPDANVVTGSATVAVGAGSYADAAGNANDMGASLTLVYHTVAPTAPTQVALNSSSDSGWSPTDGITNHTQLVFRGVATANATVKLYDTDGTTQIGNSTADGSGNWTITTSTLAEGAHTVVAKTVDTYGSLSAPSAAVPVVVDTTAPALAITSDKSALKAGETAAITFTFSEDPGTTFTRADVTVSGGTLSGLSGSGATRTATFTPAADTDNGLASVSVSAGSYADAAGNNGMANTGPALTFDTLAPTAPTAAPDLSFASDNGAKPNDDVTSLDVLTFTGGMGNVDPFATVRLYDGATLVATTTADNIGAWSAVSSKLAEGVHTITARAVDAAGNESAASAGLTVTIDQTAPTMHVTGVTFSHDTGVSSTDFVTSDPTQTISYTFDRALQPGEAAYYTLNNGGAWVSMDMTGNTWTQTITLPHSNTLLVKVVDAAGNVGPVYSQAYVIDTTAPAAPSTPDLAPGSDTGLSNSDDITAATRPTFTGTAEDGATVTLYDGATAIGSGVATGGAWQITSATTLAQGSHTITATATDVAGNVGAASSGLTVQVITTGPATGVASMALSADSGTSAHDFVTNTAAQTVSGRLDAALAANERVQVSLDHGASWADAAAAAGSDAWSYGAVLAAGSHDIQVRVLDAVGNAGPVATQAYTLDTTAPTLTIASDANPLKAGETATITFTFSEDPGATFTAADVAVSGGTLSALSGSGAVRTATFTPDADTNGATATIGVAAGSYSDTAGNGGGAGAPVSIYVDTLVPGAPPAPVLSAQSDTGVSATDGITNDATPTIQGTADANAIIFVYDGDSRVVGIIGADGTGAWHIDTDTLADGDHVLRVQQFDAIGNASPLGAPLLVTVDTSAPAAPAAPLLAAASDSGTPGDHITNVATPTFSGKADANAQVTLYDTDGHTALGTARADADGNWTITTSALADGAHDVSVRQSDVAGNWSVPGQVVALTVDTTAPAAPSAPHLQPQSDTGVRGDGVTYAMPVLTGSAAAGDLVTLYDGAVVVGTARAGTDGIWTIAAPGLHLGHHTLTATSTDAAGNVSMASGAFALTLEEAPVPPAPLVDGVRVVTVPVVLPGGGSGTQVQVPIVGADRVDSSGAGATADIPLANSAGADVLVAHVAPGYGLTATGGPVTTVADGGAALIAALQAAGSGDLAPLAGNGQGYLAQLAGEQPLLVQTIAPVTGSSAPTGTLTLSGAAGQHVALVLETAAMAGGAIALQDVDFAAVVGAGAVVAQSGARVLAGDGAAQDLTVQSGSGTQVYAGGGNDVLRFGAAPAASAHTANGATGAATAPTTTLLHGGAGDDTAVFAGARADFDVETHHGYLVVRSKAAPDAQALVVNVEHLQFSDAKVAVQNDADLAPLTGLYQAVLGRQADVHGLDFWAGVHAQGTSLGTIALAMVGSSERLATHGGLTGDVVHDVGLLYAGLFDRAPDAAGLAFWTQAVQHGATLAQVADAMLQSVEMVGQQGTPLDWNFSV